MSQVQLTSITLSNFRSIKGSITVPLDAPIVLIHGPNGAGKTSLLSGIELALTGQVASLHRVDPEYANHLVHKDATWSEVSIRTAGLDRNAASLNVRSGEITGEALLESDLARFYSERCFLAQSSLGRLLELYQDSAKRSDSALTRFVKDLLGLDQLDAIVDGLHDAGDVRRLRNDVPGYAAAKDGIQRLDGELERLRTDLASTDARIQELANRNAELNSQLVSIPGVDARAPQSKLIDLEESELTKLAGLRREIEAAQRRWEEISTTDIAQQRAAAEPRSEVARKAFQDWSKSVGGELNRVLTRLMPLFPDLPSTNSHGLLPTFRAAEEAVRYEFLRCSGLLEKEAADAKTQAEREESIKRGRARVQAIEQQISGLAAEAGSLAEALSRVQPHIHSDDCPVCGRDFNEVSSTPLNAHVSAQISELTAAAGQLQALSRDRTATLSAIAESEREVAQVSGRRIEESQRDSLKTRVALLQEVDLSLTELADGVKEGQQLMDDAAIARRVLTNLSALDQEGSALRESLSRFGAELGWNLFRPQKGLMPSCHAFRARFCAGLSRIPQIRKFVVKWQETNWKRSVWRTPNSQYSQKSAKDSRSWTISSHQRSEQMN
jgi:exonuclease SbcC